jgi:hypothetical protein
MKALDEIRARLAAATPGPWKANDDGTIDGSEYAEVICRGQVDCMAYCAGGTSVIEGDNLKADADLIANAPTDIARLLAALDDLLYIADNKTADNHVGRWWSSTIRGAIEKAVGGKP